MNCRECVCVCNIYFYIQYTYISIQYIYLWCNKYVTEPHHTFLYSPFWHTAVFLLHKHFLFTPSPFFNSPSIITNCKYAAISKPNITIYEGYPENKLLLWMLPLQCCGHDGAHACQVCWFCWKAGMQFTDIWKLSTHRVVFIMFKKTENPAACDMRSVICCSCLKAPQSMQVSIVTHFKNCATWSRIINVACLAMVFRWFITAPAHTLQYKISSRYLAGINSIIPLQPRLSTKWFSFVPVS